MTNALSSHPVIEALSSFEGSPPALGHYAPGVRAEGSFLFLSGMTPYDPGTGRIERGSIAEQTRLVLANIGRVLAHAGAEPCHVASCRVYLSDLTSENFDGMNREYAAFFGHHKPARATIGAQLPGFDVEIECVACLPPSG